jgi:hypothetical protein
MISRQKHEAWDSQIQTLTSMLEERRRAGGDDLISRCAYALAKIDQASDSLKHGDEGGTWLHLTGAVSFAQMVGVAQSELTQLRANIDQLLGYA